MKRLIPLVVLFLLSNWCMAKSKVELVIQLLDVDLIAQATLDQDDFIKWVGQTKDAIEKEAKKIEGNKEIVLLFTFHKDEPVSLSSASIPEMPSSELKQLTKNVNLKKGPRTKFVDYGMIFFLTINDGIADNKAEYKPNFLDPKSQRIQDFSNLSPAEKIKDFKLWMKDEIIPLVASFEVDVDPQFVGVRGVGDILENKSYLNKEVDELTSANPNYWRGLLEMEQWNQLIPFSKMCLYFANGEFDKGENLMFFVDLFSDSETLAGVLMDEISQKLNHINTGFSQSMQEGLALHDAGNYKGALKHYGKMLKVYPNSSWLNYEYYFSESAMASEVDKTMEMWKDARKKVYACDPMYYLDINATNGTEAYLLFRRSETRELFKSSENTKTDLLKYADIALELGNYDVSAEIYWLLLSHIPEEEFPDRDLLMYFLYSLEGLGIKNIKENFKGDFPSEFSKIEAEQDKIMKESFWYNALKND